MSDWYFIEADEKTIKKEREKARALKKTSWWQNKLHNGICYYCNLKFEIKDLTMDHIVPIARGGTSTKNNVVVCCNKCNQDKKLKIPVEDFLDKIKS